MKQESRDRPQRGVLKHAIAVAAMLLIGSLVSLEAAAQPAGGRGSIQVLLVTKGHSFDRANFFQMFDNLGETITWTHVEHPAAELFFDPEHAEPYDVLVFYDMAGRAVNLGGGEFRHPDGTVSGERDIVPSPETVENFASLLREGKGLVIFHHAIASWVHTWPEYVEVMGGACDWGREITIRGMTHPRSGYHQDTEQTISIVAPDHPITQGLGDGESFEVVDESYTCPMFEDSVTPLLRTSWRPPDQEAHEAHLHPDFEFSNLYAWVKTAENSPIAYIQGGHEQSGWENENFLQLMENAITWAASQEALDWAAANPEPIF